MAHPNLVGTTCRLASGAFLTRDFETAVEIGRLTQTGSMAKAWPRMLRLTAQGEAAFVTQGGAEVDVLDQRSASLSDDLVETLVQVRFTDTLELELGGEFWMSANALGEECSVG